jgi:prophage maintenance system killer protein
MKTTPDILIGYNLAVDETGTVISRQNLESVFSAYEYYDSNIDKVSSILRGIVKNHAFVDGNKRVGALFLYDYCFNYEKLDSTEV